MKKKKINIGIIAALICLLLIMGCSNEKYSLPDNEKVDSGKTRPDYLPAEMFEDLPPFPDDFYNLRTLISIGRFSDFENLEPKYWQQPEFFPHFEDIGMPLLQDPPKGRWGAYGIATFPGDTVASIKQGESLDLYFFIKSNYLVETYQGIMLSPIYRGNVSIEAGFSMPDGTKIIIQDPKQARDYFSVDVTPNPFILEPNYPKYHLNGTRKIRMTLTVSEDTPPGNYVVGLDTATVPEDYEQKWIKEYLNLYTSGGMTKIDRPYFQAFVEVIESD